MIITILKIQNRSQSQKYKFHIMNSKSRLWQLKTGFVFVFTAETFPLSDFKQDTVETNRKLHSQDIQGRNTYVQVHTVTSKQSEMIRQNTQPSEISHQSGHHASVEVVCVREAGRGMQGRGRRDEMWRVAVGEESPGSKGEGSPVALHGGCLSRL